MATKKVGIAGKFGSRYGKTVRDRYSRVYRLQKSNHKCPACSKGLSREAAGIWSCSTCGLKIAGKAYTPV